MTYSSLPSILLATLFAVALAPRATAQVDYYCECLQGLGPCGNDQPTGIPGGCFNSTGFKGFLGPNQGSNSVAADDLLLVAANLPPNQFGLVFMGGGRTQVPFGDGVLCIATGGIGIFRFPVRDSGPWGVIEEGPGLVAYSVANFGAAGAVTAGDSWHFQLAYRDPAGPCGSGFNFTNGIGITFTP
ncbi:MAG: hypothetical protein GY711_34255 [bacterium]|nr:hypothetical protein [bacterium]